MLIRLVPEEVNDRWDVLRPILRHSLSPVVEAGQVTMERILVAVLKEALDVWMLYGAGGKASGVITTAMSEDGITGERTMLVYSFNLYHKVGRGVYEAAVETLRRWAESKDCQWVSWYTENESMERLGRFLGYEERAKLMSMEV